MEGLPLFLVMFLVVGFAAGAGAVWLVLQGRTATAYARARSEVESTLTEMSEQLRGKEEQVLTLQSTLDQGASTTGAPKAEVEEVATIQTAFENEKAALAASLQERDHRWPCSSPSWPAPRSSWPAPRTIWPAPSLS